MLRRWHELGAQVVATGAEPTKIVASVTGQDPEIISERAPSAKYRPFLQRINGALVLVLFLTLVTVLGVELKKETVQSWDKYIAAARAREDRHLHQGKPFLWSDEVPEQA